MRCGVLCAAYYAAYYAAHNATLIMGGICLIETSTQCKMAQSNAFFFKIIFYVCTCSGALRRHSRSIFFDFVYLFCFEIIDANCLKLQLSNKTLWNTNDSSVYK